MKRKLYRKLIKFFKWTEHKSLCLIVYFQQKQLKELDKEYLSNQHQHYFQKHQKQTKNKEKGKWKLQKNY